MTARRLSAHIGYLFTEVPLEERLGLARTAGFDAVEHPDPQAVPASRMQNLLNTKSAKSSVRSLLASALFTFPIVALFLSVGTMLWLYHRHVAVTAYDPVLDQERIFPLFIVHALPVSESPPSRQEKFPLEPLVQQR